MKKLIICTYINENIPQPEGVDVIAVSEKQIGKCRGCMRCKILKQCVTYNDDAQVYIPIITASDHLDIYLQPDGTIQRLMDRVLYALDGTGKTFTFHVEDSKEVEYLRRLLVWAKYQEIQ